MLQHGRTIRVSELWAPTDYAAEEFLADEAAGRVCRVARRAQRHLYNGAEGSGTAEMSLHADGQMITVVNCRVNSPSRQVFLTDVPLIMFRASLACDTSYAVPGAERMIFRRPEVTVVHVPAGMSLIVDVAGGSSQQGLLSFERATDFAARYGLTADDLPPTLRAALAGAQTAGRVASFPVDAKVASLIAETIDSRLEGELRVLQRSARVAELVAFSLDAMHRDPALHGRVVTRRRDGDLAHLARERLEREYRSPPRFESLAHDLGTNQTKLKQVFREAFGLTMADYCLQRRLREAQQLLLDGNLTIAQVADRVGYQHQSSFTTAFKAYVDMSPREYRKHRGAFTLPLGYEPPSLPT